MRSKIVSQKYQRFYAWVLSLGLARALLLTTLIATSTSVVLTAIIMLIIPGSSDFFWYGMLVAVLSPVLSAPGLGHLAFTMVYQLNAAQTALTRAAKTDDLTGVANRRFFLEEAEQAFGDTKAHGGLFSVVMIDVDHFKSINDKHGHGVGDTVIHDVARACKEALRVTDTFARFGGEEFVALLRNTDTAGAAAIAETLRQTVAALAFDNQAPSSVTVSLGVATYLAGGASLHDILNEADRQLYAAKAAGRDRVMVADGSSLLAS